MKVSVSKDDPGYVEDSPFYEVFLDGARLDLCVTADEEQGIAIVNYKENGHIAVNEITGEFRTKVLHGIVQVRRTEGL